MLKYLPFFLLLLVSCSTGADKSSSDTAFSEGALTSYVDPFIGTGGHGHTFPGATMPFGMMQLSPDTRLEGWDGCGGYHFTDSVVYGFSHTHLSGTGVSDYGDILLKPCIGDITYDNGYTSSPESGYASRFDKASEEASPGYYKVDLAEGIRVELSTSPRAGMHRYTFEGAEQAHIMLDLLHRDQLIDADITVTSPTRIEGFRASNAWANDQRVYFVIEFSHPIMSDGIRETVLSAGPRQGDKTPAQAALEFDLADDKTLLVRVGISVVDIAGAAANLKAEIDHWDFDRLRAEADSTWNQELQKIQVKDNDEKNKTIFYTALYHTMIAPNLYSDVDGRYRKTINKDSDTVQHRIGKVPEGDHQYTVFSLWDTYRATHPLYTLTQREHTGEFIRTFLRQYEDGGQLPVWELASTYTGCMIGYHSAPVIADAYAKGITDFDGKLALEAMRHSAEMDVLGLPYYRNKGFIATRDEPESVSKTLEYAYDDWCIGDFARRMGNEDVTAQYVERAQYYKNLYNPSTAFLQGRSNGGWYAPFKPEEVNFNYTEANGWQYSLAVPQDVNGLIDLMGGDAPFVAHLDKMFSTDSETSGREQVDITGLIGQYAHGNEPSHHMAYLYAYAGQAHRTQEIVRQVMDSLYWHGPDGLSGNEDCGQMSAWYVMSAMGIYPVCPGSDDYVFGTPRFDALQLNLENGNRFSFIAEDLDKGPYIQSITLNGKPYSKGYITHSALMAGGELVYQMGSAASTYASAITDRPTQRIKDDDFCITPTITAASRTFEEALEVRISSPQQDAAIYYTLDGSTPSTASSRYEGPISISASATVKALASRKGKPGKMVEASFYQVSGKRSIRIDSEYADQYAAGGDQALIDLITGGAEFTTGDWQGYRGDLDVTIDLGEVMAITRISLGCNQNIKSWIWFPKEVTFSIGKHPMMMANLAPITHSFPDDKQGAFTQRFEREFKDTEARYIRVRAKQYGTIPDWHLGAGGDSWIFVDEVLIE